MKFIYLILGTFVPIVFMYIVGFYRELFLVRYISVFTIPFYLMIGCFISSIYERVNFNRLMLCIVLIFLICWVDQSYNPNNRIRYDTGRAITYVEDNLKYQDGIIYIPYYMKNIFIYYYDGSVEPVSIPRVEPKTFSLRMTKAEIRNDLKIAYKGKKRMWLITSFEEREFAKTISFRTRVILRNKYSEEKRKDYANVSVYLFSK